MDESFQSLIKAVKSKSKSSHKLNQRAMATNHSDEESETIIQFTNLHSSHFWQARKIKRKKILFYYSKKKQRIFRNRQLNFPKQKVFIIFFKIFVHLKISIQYRSKHILQLGIHESMRVLIVMAEIGFRPYLILEFALLRANVVGFVVVFHHSKQSHFIFDKLVELMWP